MPTYTIIITDQEGATLNLKDTGREQLTLTVEKIYSPFD
jgi:hypothetical protein